LILLCCVIACWSSWKQRASHTHQLEAPLIQLADRYRTDRLMSRMSDVMGEWNVLSRCRIAIGRFRLDRDHRWLKYLLNAWRMARRQRITQVYIYTPFILVQYHQFCVVFIR
jgi:hypothetical protein